MSPYWDWIWHYTIRLFTFEMFLLFGLRQHVENNCLCTWFRILQLYRWRKAVCGFWWFSLIWLKRYLILNCLAAVVCLIIKSHLKKCICICCFLAENWAWTQLEISMFKITLDLPSFLFYIMMHCFWPVLSRTLWRYQWNYAVENPMLNQFLSPGGVWIVVDGK